MLKLAELKGLGDAIQLENAVIENVFYCVSEDHVMAKLKDTPGVAMVVLYPQTNTTGRVDEEVDQNAIWIFILEKGVAGQTNEDEFAQYEKLQLITEQAKIFIINNYGKCDFKFLTRYQPSNTQIMPEFNEFGGFNGWSMSLVF